MTTTSRKHRSEAHRPQAPLSGIRGSALYVGALLGPSLLLLPGLAAQIAGPASVLAWCGLLLLSGLLAVVFARLGIRITGGVGEYTAAGLGVRAGRAASWCFLLGVVVGAPVVCLIGGGYVADLTGGGRGTAVVAAFGLLLAVVVLTLSGARTTTTVQLVLVAVLIALVAVAVTGSVPSARAENWVPFAPHGWLAIGPASSALMLSFVGWEAVAPLTARLRDPKRQLPRVIGTAFLVTTIVYLGLAAATVAVLGGTDEAVPLAGLLRAAVGPAGTVLATIAAVALTLAATNAYLTGAAAVLAELRAGAAVGSPKSIVSRNRLQLGIVGAGVGVLAAVGSGVIDTAELVTVPTALFLAVYLGCTVAAARIMRGAARAAAVTAACAVLAVLSFAGWAVLVPLATVIATWPERSRATTHGSLSGSHVDVSEEGTCRPRRSPR
jgi:amino acid efflux transporter